ncbi:MAG: RNA polymerase sigma factor [Actinomycetota bacterium]|nr:RNA polymerase sigma factor [Actinomycetota bacterium]
MAPDEQAASDAELAARARDGDDEAFAMLYERFSPKVFDFLARLLGDRSAAEEIAQDAFVTAYEHRSSLRHPEAVRAWLFSIAYRRAMDHLRRSGRERAGLPEAAEVASAGEDPADRLVQGEAAELVWAAAQSLEARQYAVLDLSVRKGLAGAELARVLGVSSTHAAVLAHRARTALAKAVAAVLVVRSPERCPVLRAATMTGAAEPLSPLSREQRASVERHLRQCPHCTALAKRLAAPASLLGALGPVAFAPGHGRWALVAEHIKATPGSAGPRSPSPGRFPQPRRGKRAAVAAGVALLVIAGLGLGLYLGAGPHVAGRSAPVASGKSASGPGSYASVPPLTWRVVSSPDPAGPAAYTELFGLTCASLDACWAVGDYSQTAGRYQPLVLRRTGDAWQPVPIAGVVDAQLGLLEAITCVDPTDCWAVGDRKPLPEAGTSAPNSASSAGYYVRSAILHFDGHNWNLVASPSVAGPLTVNDLQQVSCASATDCWAVGTWTKLGSTGLHPLLLHFDGTGWRLSAVPDLGRPRRFYTSLGSVMCASPAGCWMTGDYTAPDGRVLALAARLGLNGWRMLSPPNLGSQVHWAGPIAAHTTANMPPNDFRGVACPGPKDCWGAEEYLNPAGLMRFQLLHFDGRGWQEVSSPNPAGPAGEATFGEVACPAVNDCWAVGDVLPGDTMAALSLEKAFALHFDGHGWSLVALPDPGVPYLGTAGVALPSDEASALQCPSVRLCVIAGRFADGQGITGTGSLILEGRSP